MTVEQKTPLTSFPGVGAARAKSLEKLGLKTAGDLLEYLPRDYEDRSLLEDIASAGEDAPVCFQAMVTEAFRTSYVRKGMELTKGKVSDVSATVSLTFFNQTYVAKQLSYGKEYIFYGKLSGTGKNRQMANPYFEPAGANRLVGSIVPIYPLTAGITNTFLANLARQVLPLATELSEVLPRTLLKEHQLAQVEFSYRNIHAPAAWESLALARRRLIFQELLCLSLGLALLRQRRQREGGIPIKPVPLGGFYESLPFSLTGAQKKAVEDIVKDLESTQPMNRLLQGDVGSGKTVVAAAAAFVARENGCQSALMAPTELLANQHFKTMETLLGHTGMKIGLLTGSVTAKEKRQLREAAAKGEIDLLVGTHALLTEDVTFQNLALVITDEQHRFGVNQRAALSAKAQEGSLPHVLVMSATPIPRTLALLIYGDLDLSILNELPPGRTPVGTYLVGESYRQRLHKFIREKVQEGRQVYVVCPTVEEGELLDLKSAQAHGAALQKTFPDLNVSVIHGKLRAKEKERIMADFVAGSIHVLVSTTVIEVGVDVPNATLMIIENAERFGLSQLHQLRGRVGRGKEQSHCVLVSDNQNPDTKQRLKALTATTDGFLIAEEDLRLRGPGDFFGSRQHGLPQMKIASLAGDVRILHEAQAAAEKLLEEDPDLQKRAHAPLREKVYAFFQDKENQFQ